MEISPAGAEEKLTHAKIIKDLPCRVELATEKWDALIDEGMRLTQQKIESDPMLSARLPG
ncbi:hypothetical protein [Streptomyces decoyicus]|uniref:hypothetical protein n=1 Tax=Streptomyces decoyicus TaxID=249567 RepID=UPI0033AD03FF